MNPKTENPQTESAQSLRRRLEELRLEQRRVEKALESLSRGVAESLSVLPEEGEPADRLDPLDALGQLSPHFVVIHREGRVVFANDAAARAMGASSPEDLIGEPVLRFVHPEDAELARKRIANLSEKGGFVEPVIERLVRLDGSVFEAEVTGASVYYRGKPAVQVMARDITESQKARRALERLVRGTTSTGQSFFRDLTKVLCETLSVSRALIARWDRPSNRLIVLAHAARAGTGNHHDYSPEGTPCERVLREGVYMCANDVQRRFPQDRDLACLDAVSYYGVAIPSTSGETVGVLCILDDKPMARTDWLLPVMQAFAVRAGSEFDRLAHERKLENSELRFRKLFEHSHDGLVLLDLHTHRIVGANERAVRLFGRDPADLYCTTTDLIRLEDASSLETFFKSVPPHGVIRHSDAIAITPAQEIPCEISASRIMIGGEPRILLQLRDISERRQAERLLETQHRVLERLARGDDRQSCLEQLCKELEQLIGDCVATVMTVRPETNDLGLLVGPSLPEELFHEIDGLPISPAHGSCAAAAFQGGPVIVADTRNDPRWTGAQDLATKLGIGACWSFPFFCDERVVGTVAISHSSPREPTAFERQVLDVAADIAGVAEQREAVHRKVQEREQRLKGVLTTATDVIWSVDQEGRVVYFNRQAVGEELAVGRSLVDSLPIGWREPLRRAMERVALNRLPYQFEVCHCDRDSTRWFSFRVGPVVRHDTCEGFTICASETTGQKEVENQLRVNYERFRALAESAPAVIFVADESRKLSYVNARWSDLTGRERWSWKRIQDPANLVHALDREDVRLAWQRAWSQATRFEVEFRLIHADGSIRWVYVVAEPLKDDEQRCVGFVGYAMDITPLKQSIETLQQREAELAHVSRLATMGQMMAELSHEINQPLYSISNYAGALAEFLRSQDVDRFSTAIDWAERIGRIATDAGEIIRRLRSFTAHPSPSYERLELATTVREAVSLLEWQLRKTNVSLELHGFDKPHPVTADRVAIQQVVVNLLKNACEAVEGFESKRTPRIRVTIQGDARAVQVEIADNGRGLPDCDPEDLFLAFTSYHPGGSGMGLAVSRSIVEQHGGKIWATSNAEGGATFTFRIPRQVESEPTSSPTRFE